MQRPNDINDQKSRIIFYTQAGSGCSGAHGSWLFSSAQHPLSFCCFASAQPLVCPRRRAWIETRAIHFQRVGGAAGMHINARLSRRQGCLPLYTSARFLLVGERKRENPSLKRALALNTFLYFVASAPTISRFGLHKNAWCLIKQLCIFLNLAAQRCWKIY